MTEKIFQLVAQIQTNGQSAALATVVRTQGSTPRRSGSKMIVYADGQIVGTVGGGEMESRVINEAQDAINSGKPRLLEYTFADPKKGDPGICGGTMEVYVESIQPKPQIIIVGIGHVGQAVAHLAKWLGYYVIVSDDRPEFVTPELTPDADEHLPVSVEELFDKVTLHSQTYVVLTTRKIGLDIKSIPHLLESDAAYIGVIGSKRRWETTKKRLKEAGISAKDLKRIASPIGLELNAETPEEIAVSILAEITMLRQGGDGERMSE